MDKRTREAACLSCATVEEGMEEGRREYMERGNVRWGWLGGDFREHTGAPLSPPPSSPYLYKYDNTPLCDPPPHCASLYIPLLSSPRPLSATLDPVLLYTLPSSSTSPTLLPFLPTAVRGGLVPLQCGGPLTSPSMSLPPLPPSLPIPPLHFTAALPQLPIPTHCHKPSHSHLTAIPPPSHAHSRLAFTAASQP